MTTAGDWKLMLTAVLGVFVSIASLLLIAWLFYKGGERTQRSPRLRQAFFVGLVVIYAVWMAISIVKVILGKESTEVLLGLPGGLLLIWLYLRAANKVQTPS
jgi:membrane associated rhomboid family serine protease